MNVLILGCGTIGTLVGGLLVADGHHVLGVRRQPLPLEAGFRIVPGDIADPGWWSEIAMLMGESWEDHVGSGVEPGPPFHAVLLAANPGLRRGRDNGLERAARLVGRFLPGTRLVYTGTTAVYADAGGADVNEDGQVDAADPAIAGLLAIETAVLAHGGALVLRMPALIGPTRQHALERLRSGDGSVRGVLSRPFSFLHELDCAELCVEALVGQGGNSGIGDSAVGGGGLGTGILNAASPLRITAREYYASLARAAGVPEPRGDDSAGPSRWIDASRLWRMMQGHVWRGFEPARV